MENIKIISSFTQTLSLMIFEKNDSISSKFAEYLNSIFKNISYTKFQEEMYEKIDTNDIDIVIIDLATQDKESGFTFVKHIRERNPYIKILVYSSFSDIHLLQNCIRYDVSGFITDESNLTDLKSYIKNCIEKIFITLDNKLLKYKFENLKVLDCIKYLAEDRDSKVTIVSHYKGLPLIREAIIIYYDDQSVKLKINEIQIKTLKVNDTLALSSIYLGMDILVNISEIDSKNNYVILNYINFIDSFIHHRKTLRLEPEAEAELIISDKNKRRVKSQISNISINHMLCEISSYNEFNMHAKLNIALRVNKNSKIIIGNAIVKDIFNTNSGFKMLMKFTLGLEDHQFLENYLSKRVKDLINELKFPTSL